MIWVLDGLLALALVGLAARAMSSGGGLFRSIIALVLFGVVMALVWGRLGAPDLALAEAAIGAGITGALLLGTYRRLTLADRRKRGEPFVRRSRLALPVAVLSGGLVAALGLSSGGVEAGPGTAGVLAREALPRLNHDDHVGWRMTIKPIQTNPTIKIF